MDKKKIDKTVDNVAAKTKETLGLMADKIDQATECAVEKGQQIKETVRMGTLKATDRVEEAVAAAASRVREKVGKDEPAKKSATVKK